MAARKRRDRPSPACRPCLDAVVTVANPGRTGQTPRWGTGFFCRATHWHNPARQLLFLVTSGHGVGSGAACIETFLQPRTGRESLVGSVTGAVGPGPTTWHADRTHDLAAVLLDPERFPEDLVRCRSFDVETDVLSLRQLRRKGIVEGDEALLVGFVQPEYPDDRREYPAVRLATLSEIPPRVTPEWPILAEGTALPGDSGSPVMLRGDGMACDPHRDEGVGELVGVVQGAGTPAKVLRSGGDGRPVEVEQTNGMIRLVPGDALRDLIRHAVGNTILAETFGPMVQRVRGWFRRKR